MHRTVAAIFTSFTSIGILAMLHDRPSMGDIVTWIDCETILLIFSMMVLVAILTDTGFFEYVAVYTFQVRKTEKPLSPNFIIAVQYNISFRAFLFF